MSALSCDVDLGLCRPRFCPQRAQVLHDFVGLQRISNRAVVLLQGVIQGGKMARESLVDRLGTDTLDRLPGIM